MKAQSKTQVPKDGGKSISKKRSIRKSKPTRAKRVRSLAPRQFIDIIEHISDGLVVLDKDWHYVYLNQKAADMLQRQSPSELIGKHIWTEYPEGIGQPFQIAYEKAMRDQTPIVFEDHYEPWDLWFENRIYPSPDRLLILFTEITDRKRIERLLNERQYFLQKVLDTEPGTVYIYDLEERRNVYINRYWLLAYGYTEEETQAMGDQILIRLIHPDDLMSVSVHHENWRQAGEGDTREIEYRIRTKTGEWRWLYSREVAFGRDEAGKVKQILGVTHDVTDGKVAQEALRRSEQQLGLIYDSVSDIIFLLSIEPEEHYRFVSVNQAFLQATGLGSDQVIGRFAHEIIPPSSQPLVFGNYRRAIQERIPVTWEEVADYPAGQKTAIVTINAVYDEAEHCTHLVGIIHDITERKQAEQALRESEEKFSKVFHASPVALTIRRASDGHYVEVNDSFLKRMEYRRDEVIGRTALDIGAWANPGDREEMLQTLREQGSLRNFETQFRTKSGEIGMALLFREIIELAGEKYFIGTTLDITERKQMEKAALKERDFSDAMLNSLPGIFYFYDETGKFLRWNRNLEIVSGYSAEEIARMNPLDFFATEEKDYIAQRIQNVFEYGESDAEARLVRKNGVLRPYYFTGRRIEIENVPYLIGMGIDITERKQVEKALRESEKRYQLISTVASDYMFSTQLDTKGQLTLNWVAGAFESITGYTLEEYVAHGGWRSTLHPNDLAVDDLDLEKLHANKPVISEVRTLTKNGQLVWVRVYAQPVLDAENKKLIGIYGAVQDITDRKRAEAELRKLNLELEERIAARTKELAAAMIRAQESDRLKSAFLATMSHELRTPLNSIIGFTGVILQGLAGPLNEEQTKQLNMTRDSARHLLALINDVLDISKIEAGQLEILKRPFDMRQSVESALRVVHPLALKKNLELVLSVGSGVGILNNDRRRVEQVLINLINNAIKFTERGKVSIECQVRGSWLETSVHDEGIGIKSEDLGRLFQPFQQIDIGLARGHEGSGLGLSICKHLVTAMGGEISVESQWGVGSTFKFTLPAQESQWQKS